MNDDPELWSRLHPATLAIRAIERLPELVLGLPAAAYFIGDAGLYIAGLLAVTGLIASMAFAYLYWRRFSYWIGEEQLVIESGILSRNRRTIPFDRIQDVSLEQKLLARLFGVSIVRIETGGSGGDEGELNCISRTEADHLRDTVRAFRSGNTSRSPDVDPDERDEAPVLFTMGIGRLLVAGLFNFSLVFLAILGGASQYLGDYFDFGQWVDDYGEKAIGLVSALSILSLLFLLLLVGMITGLVRTVARDFGFRLSQTETGIRRQRGLFTRTDVVIPLRRIQAGILTTGAIKRLFGWRELAVQSLGTDGSAGTHHVVAPLAQSDDLPPILSVMNLPEPPPISAYQRVSHRFVWRSWIEDGALLAIIMVIVSFLWSGWLWLFIMVLWALLGPLLQYRAHGYCVSGDYLFVRRGVLRPRITILPLIKAQSTSLVQGVTQQGFGLTTLAIGTAGADRSAALRILDLEDQDARGLLETHFSPA